MKPAIIVFPGSNCDRDVRVALRRACGVEPVMVWHGDGDMPTADLIVLPGGFSFGDYLRCGAIGAHSPIMREVRRRAEQGVAVLAICNGFQIACECRLLPGVLMANASGRFVCRPTGLRVDASDTVFTRHYRPGQRLTMPVAHHEGAWFADPETLARLQGEGRIIFRYDNDNPNGSLDDIAGIASANRRILGMMPHPERACDPALGGTDGEALFLSALEALA